jgi:hypothetical protein
VYDRSIQSGSSVVTVRVPGEHVDGVTRILERHQPIDIDERAASLGLGANRTFAAAADTQRSRDALANGGEEVIALSEEQLTVGKRLVNRGTTHIRRFVVETPVEENNRQGSRRARRCVARIEEVRIEGSAVALALFLEHLAQVTRERPDVDRRDACLAEAGAPG